MPRRQGIATVAITVRVPEEIDRQVNLLLIDPLSGRMGYGNRSQLVSNLLDRWVKERRNELAGHASGGDISGVAGSSDVGGSSTESAVGGSSDGGGVQSGSGGSASEPTFRSTEGKDD